MLSNTPGSELLRTIDSHMPTILIVEDEPKMLRLLELNLADAGYTTRAATTAENGLKILASDKVDLVLSDVKLPGMSGLEFLQAVKRANAAIPVVMMTAYGTVESAVEAMKDGASDFVLKPFSIEEIKLIVRKELEVRRLHEENRQLREALGQRYQFDNIIGNSPGMQEVLAAVEQVAPTNATVLLGGESGVGKDMIARAIHQHSRRVNGPFVKINCTAIPENLLESELFGYEKGAFTGAVAAKPGKFELADKGTIFLDEIGDMPGSLQVKLLRVLQEREFERLGGTRTIKVDVRVVAATNQDLRAALEQGTFREDLYYRLNVVPISIPPLREHKEDIPYLVDHFIKRFAESSGKAIEGITPEAMNLLADFHWPGNVRELENIIERAVVMASGPKIGAGDIRLDIAAPGSHAAPQAASGPATLFLPEGMTLEQFEEKLIGEALQRAGGNKSQAARLLGLSRNALRYRLSKIGVPDEPES
jgi:DNA-binding NtrC family response regulator